MPLVLQRVAKTVRHHSAFSQRILSTRFTDHVNHKMLVRAQLYFCWAVETRGLGHAHCWLRAIREVCMTLLFWCHLPPVPQGQWCLCPCGCAPLHLPPWQRRCDGHEFRPRKENLVPIWDETHVTHSHLLWGCVYFADVVEWQPARVAKAWSCWPCNLLLTNCDMYIYPQCPNLYSEQAAITTASWWWSKPKWWTVGPLRAPPLEVRWSQLEATL